MTLIYIQPRRVKAANRLLIWNKLFFFFNKALYSSGNHWKLLQLLSNVISNIELDANEFV